MNDIIADRKILHVATLANVMTHFKMPLLQALAEYGAKQTIFCTSWRDIRDRELADTEKMHTEELLGLGYDVVGGHVGKVPGFRTAINIIRLSRLIRRRGIEVVMAHQPTAAMVALPAAKLVPGTVKIYFTGGLKNVMPIDKIIIKHGEMIAIRMSDATMLINKEDFEYVRNLKGLAGKVYMVGASEGSGIDTDVFNQNQRQKYRDGIRRELRLGNDEIVVGFMGRCIWDKGFREIIRMAARQKEKAESQKLRFMVVGMGPDINDIISYTDKYKVRDMFLFTGYRHDVHRYLAAFDVFILPSYREGMPTSLLQAMAMGIPCIGTNIRGVRELIGDAESGLMVEPRDDEGLSRALDSIISNPERARRMGISASEKVEREHSRKVLLPMTIETISGILERKHIGFSRELNGYN